LEEASTSPESKRSRRYRRHAGITVTGALLLVVLILVPAASVSFYHELATPGSGSIYTLSPPNVADPSDGISVQFILEAITPWANTAQVRVSGRRSCSGTCPATRVLVASLPGKRAPAGTLPSVESIDLPAGANEFSRVLSMPVEGSWLDYPFDTYQLALAVAQAAAGNDRASASLDETPLQVTLEERLTDYDLKQPQVVPAAPLGGDPNAVSAEITATRPVYLQAATATIVLLAVGAAIYGVFMRPFKELVIGATGLALSLWGVRNLLMGAQPGETTVDFVLLGVITFVLIGITARVLIALIQNKAVQ
jgi:hypothetical protein